MNMETKVIQYRDETTTRVRVFAALVVVPFMAILAATLASTFGLFSTEALYLLESTLLGDFSRFGDFVGYLVLLMLCIGLPCAAIYVSIIKGVIAPNTVVTFNTSLQIVSINRDLPWGKSRNAEYSFSDVEAVELKNSSQTVSDQNEIWLRIRGIKKPLVLATIFDSEVATKEFRILKGIGLPNR